MLGDVAFQESETSVHGFTIANDLEQVILIGEQDKDTDQSSWAALLSDFESEGMADDVNIFGHRWALGVMNGMEWQPAPCVLSCPLPLRSRAAWVA